MNEPWTCPVCKAGVAPWTARCDHGTSGEVLAGHGWPWPAAAPLIAPVPMIVPNSWPPPGMTVAPQWIADPVAITCGDPPGTCSGGAVGAVS